MSYPLVPQIRAQTPRGHDITRYAPMNIAATHRIPIALDSVGCGASAITAAFLAVAADAPFRPC